MGSAKWHWQKLLRDWKTRIILVAFFLFFSSFSLFYRQQKLDLPLDQVREQYRITQQLFHIIPETHFEGELGEEVYDLLAQQQRLYGMQRYILSEKEGNTVEAMVSVVDNYLDNGRIIAENQLLLWEMTDFSSYTLLTSVLPDHETLQQDLAFYQYLNDHQLNIEWNPYSASQVFYQQVELIVGVVLFLFASLLAADRFTQDQKKNWSVTQGIPISWKKQWHQRSMQLWLLMWSVTVLGMGISYAISLWRETAGSLWYPVAVYNGAGIEYVATWQYILLLVGLGMLLSYVILLLATGLSWIIRNIYLTIGLVVGVYFIPSIWQLVEPFSSWQPSLYLQIVPVVRGTSAEQFGLASITSWKMMLLLIVYLLILEGIFTAVFNFIPTKTMGLKRRRAS
ncbi:hypothetical protein JTF06_13855 [Desemzia sp. RIT804]|uniref:hypothetical protein n=1 Tax=Desemzia sp. RIT 804 TaxID=2810209 RepID=UPI00194E83E3|nr:hypothetical protein [Desemzia sp. RIT 804]MBM6615972.1 hypothetical protein [Desemzia sp. RIT 804]